jgi:catechol 2,3-dioxygenase-like lactoylglutathione lyase family enzyme
VGRHCTGPKIQHETGEHAWPWRVATPTGDGPAVQVMPTARTSEEGARRTRTMRRTDLGGWEGRRLTGVGYPRRRAGGWSAQRRQTRGEVAGAEGVELSVSSRTPTGWWRRWRLGGSVLEVADLWWGARRWRTSKAAGIQLSGGSDWQAGLGQFKFLRFSIFKTLKSKTEVFPMSKIFQILHNDILKCKE